MGSIPGGFLFPDFVNVTNLNISFVTLKGQVVPIARLRMRCVAVQLHLFILPSSPGERTPSTHVIGGWVSPRAGLYNSLG